MSRQPVYINNYISIKSTLFQEQNGEQAYDVDDCPITFDTHNVRVCPTNVTIMCSHPVWVFRLIGLYSGAVSFKVICSRRPYRDAYQWDLSLNMRPVSTAKHGMIVKQIILAQPKFTKRQNTPVAMRPDEGGRGRGWTDLVCATQHWLPQYSPSHCGLQTLGWAQPSRMHSCCCCCCCLDSVTTAALWTNTTDRQFKALYCKLMSIRITQRPDHALYFDTPQTWIMMFRRMMSTICYFHDITFIVSPL